MPLITCPDCDTQISDNALACPSCGYHIGSHRPWWHWLAMGGLALAVVLLAFVVGKAVIDGRDDADCQFDSSTC